MPTIRKLFLHDAALGGVETTLPAHLIGADKWRTQHNIRVNPALEQVPKKVVFQTYGTEDFRWIGSLPTGTPGYGQMLLLTPTTMLNFAGSTVASGFADDGMYRRWATAIYAGTLYFVNESNALCSCDGYRVTNVANVAGRYLAFWYDHAVIGWPAGQPNRVQWSDLHDFSDFTPRRGSTANEADFYDFVEWQQLDFPYAGVTGLAKLGSRLIVYTPTAVIPLVYVGLPKVIQVDEAGILTRTGNTFPWTLVALGNVHFFYDAEESMFLAYTGGGPAEPVGEPVRQFMIDNLNPSVDLASRMYGFIDNDNREIWWPFVSTASTGAFDKAVVFNFKYKRWYTASVENVQSFVSGTRTLGTIAELTGAISALSGSISSLGVGAAGSPRLFGSSVGQLLREEVEADLASVLLPADDPVLESADFHYGDLRTVKENDAIVINAWWPPHDDVVQNIDVKVHGRDYLAKNVDWANVSSAGPWTPGMIDGELNYPTRYGRVLRYRFTGTNVRALSFSAFSDRVRVEVPEK